MNLEIISKYPVESRHLIHLLFMHGAWPAAWVGMSIFSTSLLNTATVRTRSACADTATAQAVATCAEPTLLITLNMWQKLRGNYPARRL